MSPAKLRCHDYGGKIVWTLGVLIALMARLALHVAGVQTVLGRRVEVATPLNSLFRLAEGHWLRQLGLSPYAGSAYHGSPLLLSVLGPLLHRRSERWLEGRNTSLNALTSVVISMVMFLVADILAALLLHAIGHRQNVTHSRNMASLGINLSNDWRNSIRDFAGLLYLVNPLTIVSCVGGSSSPVENLVTILGIYGAVTGNIPLAAFGWVLSTHLSMYPAILIIPIAFMLVSGLDRPQRKLYALGKGANPGMKLETEQKEDDDVLRGKGCAGPRGAALRDLVTWSTIWWLCILGLCSLALGTTSSLNEMFMQTYGFTLTVNDLTPNLGLFWYFFTEMYNHFRAFFTVVFHANIMFLIVPLTVRMPHRPLFLSCIMLVICSLLKSYPSVGDAALYYGFLPLFAQELSEMRFTFLLLFGEVLVMFLGPVMYNLWIWRGTGNANFYFAISLLYATLKTILVVECLGTMIRHDRHLKIALEQRSSVDKVLDGKRD